MRTTLVAVIAAAVAGSVLAASAAFLLPPPFGQREVTASSIRPLWTEIKWPFPTDQWGTGRAFTCKAADCGVKLTLYVRAKIGFCNCTTGVADDEELERVSDVELGGGKYAALGPGRAVTAAAMKGRSRHYVIAGPGRARASALAVAVNDRCDVVAATAFIPRSEPAAWEPAVMEFLNGDMVRAWAEKTLGL
jgi:hypothetical protein